MSATKNKPTGNALTLLNLCRQYKKYKEESPPLPRYDIVSPYVPISDTNPNLLFTKEQLDMRRKVEILRYQNNQMNSKTNNTTKKQNWSFLTGQTSHTKICKDNPYGETLTTQCDVPGPPMVLFYDPTVPLYNYISNREQIVDYSSSVQVNIWDVVIFEDAEFSSKKLTTCFDLLYNSTKTGRTTYSFQTPLSINLQGTKDVFLGPLYMSVHEIEVQLTNVKCIIFYGVSPVKSLSTINLQMPTFNFKVVLPNDGGDFLATKYIGNLIANNITLYTEYQYVYDVKLSFEISIKLYDINGNIINTQSDTTIFLNEVLANITKDGVYYNNVFNCEFSNPYVPTFVDFDIESNPPNGDVYIAYGDLQN
jgi:hypothetical protein